MPTFVAPSTGNHPGSPRPSRVSHQRQHAVHVARTSYGSDRVSCDHPPGSFAVCAGKPAISQGRNQKLPVTHQHPALRVSAPSPACLTGKPFRASAWLSFSPSDLRPIAEGHRSPGCPRHRGTRSPRRPWLNELRSVRVALGPPRVDSHHFVRDGSARRPSLSSSPDFERRTPGVHALSTTWNTPETSLYRIKRRYWSLWLQGFTPTSLRRTGRATLMASSSTGLHCCAGG